MNPAIRVSSLGKRYRLGLTHARSLNEIAARCTARLRGRPVDQPPEQENTRTTGGDFWALQDINFEVAQGEVVGIIGRNGAGKSTLLKILSRVTRPTTGQVDLRGRVGSLLEVGTGFHPELTGRENVFMNGTLLGMTKREVARRFDEILDFAGVEKFIDTPVKRYSSGMKVRLGFAVAAHLEPEILIVDEVLAVGDIGFQQKCVGKMKTVAGTGRTILFVSHNMAALRKLCTRAVLLSGGIKVCEGDVEDVVNDYILQNASISEEQFLPPPSSSDAPGRILRMSVRAADGEPRTSFRLREPWTIEILFRIDKALPHVIIAAGAITMEDVGLFTQYSHPRNLEAGTYRVEFTCDYPLSRCDLRLTLGLSSLEKTFHYLEKIGFVGVQGVAVGEQPIRSEGVGVLLPVQTAHITPATELEIA